MCAGRVPTIFGDGLQGRNFVYVENVVQALWLASQVPGVSGKVFNIGNGRSTTILELVAHLNRLLGSNLQPIHAAPRAGDVRQSQADISSACRALGYAPAISFEEGLARTLKFFQPA